MKKLTVLLSSVFLVHSLFSQPIVNINTDDAIKEAVSLLNSNPLMAIESAKSIMNNANTNTKPTYYIKSAIILGTGYRKTEQYDSSIFT